MSIKPPLRSKRACWLAGPSAREIAPHEQRGQQPSDDEKRHQRRQRGTMISAIGWR
jgi:hypothetical protein